MNPNSNPGQLSHDQLRVPQPHRVLEVRAGTYTLASEGHPERNEDWGYVKNWTIILADGMGGPGGGDVASRMAVGRVANHLDLPDMPHPVASDGQTKNAVVTAVELANTDIYNENIRLKRYKIEDRMGTMIVGVQYHMVPAEMPAHGRPGRPSRLHGELFYVGDARAYLLRDDINNQRTVTPLTLDNRSVKEHRLADAWKDQIAMADASKTADLNEEQQAKFERRNEVAVAIGTEEDTVVHTESFSARPNDLILLCSDGVHDILEDNDISDVMVLVRDSLVPKESALFTLMARDVRLREAVQELVWAQRAVRDGGGSQDDVLARGAQVLVYMSRARIHFQPEHVKVRGLHSKGALGGGKAKDDMRATFVQTPVALAAQARVASNLTPNMP